MECQLRTIITLNHFIPQAECMYNRPVLIIDTIIRNTKNLFNISFSVTSIPDIPDTISVSITSSVISQIRILQNG